MKIFSFSWDYLKKNNQNIIAQISQLHSFQYLKAIAFHGCFSLKIMREELQDQFHNQITTDQMNVRIGILRRFLGEF